MRTMARDRAQEGEDAPPEELERRRVPRWKQALLVAAGLFVIAGVTLRAMPHDEPPPAAQGSSASGAPAGGLASGFLPGEEPGGGTTGAVEAPADTTDWSPFFLKGGLGFFLGFAIGLTLRTFFKLSALAVGLFALVLIGLSYAGVVDVDWARMASLFDTLVARLGTEIQSLRAFVAGTVPATALSGLGLVAGFKR